MQFDSATKAALAIYGIATVIAVFVAVLIKVLYLGLKAARGRGRKG